MLVSRLSPLLLRCLSFLNTKLVAPNDHPTQYLYQCSFSASLQQACLALSLACKCSQFLILYTVPFLYHPNLITFLALQNDARIVHFLFVLRLRGCPGWPIIKFRGWPNREEMALPPSLPPPQPSWSSCCTCHHDSCTLKQYRQQHARTGKNRQIQACTHAQAVRLNAQPQGCVHMQAHVHTHACITQASTHQHTHTHTHSLSYSLSLSLSLSLSHTHTHTHTHAHIHTHPHKHTHIQALYMSILTHILTHTRKCWANSPLNLVRNG